MPNVCNGCIVRIFYGFVSVYVFSLLITIDMARERAETEAILLPIYTAMEMSRQNTFHRNVCDSEESLIVTI